MSNKKAYHLDLDDKKVAGAKYAILPGDPDRVEHIAKKLDSESKPIAKNREYCTYRGNIHSQKVLVTSTGIGGPSTSIAVDELAQLGLRTFLRVGTTGAIQEYINVGDVIITTGSVRLDGASTHYAPIEYPAVADFEIVQILIEAAKSLNITHHTGITASTDTFYPGQERYDSSSKYVIKRFQGTMSEWQKLHVLNYEMESATLFTMANALGLRAGCVSGVIVNRIIGEEIIDLEIGEKNAIDVAVKAMKILVKKSLSQSLNYKK